MNSKGKSRLWGIVQSHLDQQTYRVSRRQLALAMDVSPQTLKNWHDGLKKMPEIEHMHALAKLTGVPYERVLQAALTDVGYLEESESLGDTAPKTEAG